MSKAKDDYLKQVKDDEKVQEKIANDLFDKTLHQGLQWSKTPRGYESKNSKYSYVLSQHRVSFFESYLNKVFLDIYIGEKLIESFSMKDADYNTDYRLLSTLDKLNRLAMFGKNSWRKKCKEDRGKQKLLAQKKQKELNTEKRIEREKKKLYEKYSK